MVSRSLNHKLGIRVVSTRMGSARRGWGTLPGRPTFNMADCVPTVVGECWHVLPTLIGRSRPVARTWNAGEDQGAAGAGSFTAAEVAAMLGVSRQAVQARAQRGSLRAYKEGGVWRIPAEVATALVTAEHHRGLSAGKVRALPVGGAQIDADADASAVLRALEARLDASDARAVEQDRRLEDLRAQHREQLAAKESELRLLRAEVERLRRGVIALASATNG